MANLAAKLQTRLDEFQNRFGEAGKPKAIDRDDLVWEVTNMEFPEGQRHAAIVQGVIIDRFVLNGFYDIKKLGTVAEVTAAQKKLQAAKEAQGAKA